MSADGWFLSKNAAEFIQMKFNVPKKKMKTVKKAVYICIYEGNVFDNFHKKLL